MDLFFCGVKGAIRRSAKAHDKLEGMDIAQVADVERSRITQWIRRVFFWRLLVLAVLASFVLHIGALLVSFTSKPSARGETYLANVVGTGSI